MIKIGSEYKYRLSSTCLKSGLLILPASMKGLFPAEGEVKAIDTHSSKEYNIQIIDKRRVFGFKSFMEANSLIVNDYIIILLDDDGSYSLRVEKCTRSPRSNYKTLDLDKVLDKLYLSGQARSEAEICQFYKIAETDKLHKKLLIDGRFIYQSGRWQILKVEEDINEYDGFNVKVIRSNQSKEQIQSQKQIQASEQSKQIELKASENLPNRPLVKTDNHSYNNVKDFFRLMGYRLTVLGPDKMSLKINLGRRKYAVLVHFLEQGQSLDWAGIMNQRRSLGLDYVAIFANHRDLLRLSAPANSSRISLWSWKAFQRLVDYSKSVAISPIDLEPHFATEGLFERGAENLEAKIHNIISSRGRFSAVLESLATMKPFTVFFLDDIQLEDYSRDEILKVLDLLEHSPFQIVQRIAAAEFFLRQPVSTALEHFSQYSLSLKSRLPKAARYHVKESNEEAQEWQKSLNRA